MKSLISRLESAMAEETVHLGRLFAHLEAYAEALRTRDWAACEAAMTTLDALSKQLEDLEFTRHTAYTALAGRYGAEDLGFYDLVVLLDKKHRDGLAEAYRELKRAAVRIESMNSSIAAYARISGETVRTALEHLFPHKRGTLYSRAGTASPGADDHPMVVNRHL
jgi:hypothetical protein